MVLRRDDGLNDSLRLWRYMDFDQFVNILATKSLWLAPLSSMEDKREGKWIELIASEFEDGFREHYDYAASQTVISSWVAAPDESLPLWNAHARAETGIAISTDVFSLVEVLSGKSITDDSFLLTRVEYRPEPEPIHLNPPTVFVPVACAKYKSSDFQFENEIRVVYSRSALLAATGNDMGVPRPAEPGEGTHTRVKKIANIKGTGIEVWEMKRVDPGAGTHKCAVLPTEGKFVDYSLVPPASGTRVKVKSIDALMKKGVYVSPRAQPWMYDTVKSVLNAYGHNCALVRESAFTRLFKTETTVPFEHAIKY